MSRPTKPTYDLTDAAKRDLTQLIALGRPLPEMCMSALDAIP